MEEVENQKLNDLNIPKKKNTGKIVARIFGVIFTILFLTVLGFSLQFKIRYEVRQVIGKSMLPTFNVGENDSDTVYVNTSAKLKNGDIVVAYSNTLKEYIIKRCIAVGGQTVNIVGENKIGEVNYSENHLATIQINVYEKYYVVVDGVKLEENYIANLDNKDKTMEREFRHFCYYKYNNYGSEIEKDLTLREDEYFVLGDNRNNSTDSSVIGPLKKTEMIGRVDFILKDNLSFVQECLQKLSFMFIIKT